MPIRYTVPDLPHQPTGVHIRAVAGKPGYAVTDTGDVYGCRVGGHGVMYRSEWRLLKQKRRKPMPHLEVRLGKGDPGTLVHRLVLETFIGPCPDGMECRHLNGDPTDNRLSNLVWGTHGDNQRDRHTHRTTPQGDTHGCSKLSEIVVRELREQYDGSKHYASTAAARLGVHPGTVRRALRRAMWRHI